MEQSKNERYQQNVNTAVNQMVNARSKNSTKRQRQMVKYSIPIQQHPAKD